MFSYFKKFLVILSSISILIALPAYAKLLDQDDPCKNLSGKWKGTWNYLDGNCHWDMLIDASTYNDDIRFIVTFSNSSSKRYCYPDTAGPFLMAGTCKDSTLKLTWNTFAVQKLLSSSTVDGRIIGDVLTLETSRHNGVLNKQN